MADDYTEAKVKDYVKRTLKAFGDDQYNFWPVQTGMGASTLDCLSCINGRFVSIETKRPGKTWTPRQLIIRNQIQRAGGLTFLIDTKEEAKSLLQALRDLCR